MQLEERKDMFGSIGFSVGFNVTELAELCLGGIDMAGKMASKRVWETYFASEPVQLPYWVNGD